MTDEYNKPFTKADVSRAVEIFKTKYPDLFALYIHKMQNPPEQSVVDIILQEYDHSPGVLILHVIVREGFDYGRVGNIYFMAAIGLVLNDQLGR